MSQRASLYWVINIDTKLHHPTSKILSLHQYSSTWNVGDYRGPFTQSLDAVARFIATLVIFYFSCVLRTRIAWHYVCGLGITKT